MSPNKACAVVLRERLGLQLLAFAHPLAGIQLVKGTIEPNESPALAAARELLEEAGVRTVGVARPLDVWEAGFLGQVWSFQLCHTDRGLPDSWVHHTVDGGGLDLQFFWHRLGDAMSSEWHPVYRRAVTFIQSAVASSAVQLIALDDALLPVVSARG